MDGDPGRGLTRSHYRPWHVAPRADICLAQHWLPHAPQLNGSVTKVDATASRRKTSAHGWHALHVAWLQIGVDAGQTFPQAPQLFGSEFRSVHVPLQQAAAVGQQT